jgi:hypothetical protein
LEVGRRKSEKKEGAKLEKKKMRSWEGGKDWKSEMGMSGPSALEEPFYL